MAVVDQTKNEPVPLRPTSRSFCTKKVRLKIEQYVADKIREPVWA
jgi:hypothetical protein